MCSVSAIISQSKIYSFLKTFPKVAHDSTANQWFKIGCLLQYHIITVHKSLVSTWGKLVLTSRQLKLCPWPHIFFHDLELIIFYRMILFPEQDNKSISLLTNFCGYFSSTLHLWIELSSLNHIDWNNRLVPNRKRSMSRLYIVTLLI